MSTEFAKSLSGHDKDHIYLVLRKDERFAYLVNGTTKPLDAPKKKSMKHIQSIKNLPGEVTGCLSEPLTDTAVKRAIKLYNAGRNTDGNH